MKNWLFLDIDEVICTNRHSIAIGEIGGIRTGFDPDACRLIEAAIEGHEVHLVISSSWRYTQADWDQRYFFKRFRSEGFQELARAFNRTISLFRGHELWGVDPGFGWSTGRRLERREDEIDNYVDRWCEGDCVVVLDDMSLDLTTTTGFVRVTTPLDGLSTANYCQLRDAFDAGECTVFLEREEFDSLDEE